MTAKEALILSARLAWDGDEAKQGMNDAGQQAENLSSKIGSAMKKIGGVIAAAFTVDKIIDFGKACIEAGAEVSAEMSAFEQIMGSYTDEANAKVQSIADNTGMVATRLTPYMTSMTAKFKGLGYGIEDATGLAARGLNLAADGAAFWDMSLDESTSHLNSFINGSYEGGEAIGLFANDTQMAAYAVKSGVISSTKEWANLDEATKQATRLEYAENMYKQSGATGQAAKESGQYANVMANLAEKWRQFKALIGEPLIQNVVTPAVQKLSQGIDLLSKAVDYVKKHFEDWKPYIVGVIDAMGILTAAFVGFQIGNGISLAVQAIKSAEFWTGLWAKAQAALNFVMNLNPLGIIIGVIAALVAAIVIAYQKSDTFRAYVDKLWAAFGEKLQPVLRDVGNFIQNTVVPAFQRFGEYIQGNVVPVLQELGSWLKDRVLSAIQSVANWISTQLLPTLQSWWSYIKTAILPALQELWSAIQTHVVPSIKLIIDKVKEVLTAMAPVLDAIAQAWSTAWNNVKIVAQTVWNAIKVVVQTALQLIHGIIKTVTAVIKGDWSGAWEGIKFIVSTVWNGIKALIKTAFNGIKSFISNTLKGIGSIWGSVWSAIKGVAAAIWNNIKSTITDKFNETAKSLSGTIEKIRDWMSFSGMVEKVKGIFGDIKDGIVEKIEAAKEKVKEIVDKIVGFFTGAKFKWPDIEMPHFVISPAGWKIGDLLKGDIPKLSIDWYAKAMDKAAVLDGATIFGAAGGQLLGGGENGREVVSGEAHLIDLIGQAVAQNNAALLDVLARILAAIQALDTGLYDQIVDALTDGVKFKFDGREFGRLVKTYA